MIEDMIPQQPRPVDVGGVTFGAPGEAPALMTGLCVLQDEAHAVASARRLQEIARAAGLRMVFKASYDKANRTSAGAYRGPGLEAGLRMLETVRAETGLPVTTDVHDCAQAERAAASVDCIQIPAFLCRQTDLLAAAAATGKPVNVKKGQFLAPEDMRQVVGKLEEGGCEAILVTERGASFGYRNLVVDMRSLVLMRECGWPVIFDATHSVQLPGGAGTSSGGDRRFVAPLVRAAAAVGVDGLFLETHECPDQALCDGPNSLAMDDLPALLAVVRAVDAARRH